MQNSRLTTPSRWNLWKSLKFPALHAELFQKTIRQNKDLGIRAHLELEPILELEPPSNLAKRISARALIPVNTVIENLARKFTLFEKSNFCPKIQFWQNPNIFTSFSSKFFWTIFLVKSKLSIAKKSKITSFSTPKIDNFLGKSKLNFWTKN